MAIIYTKDGRPLNRSGDSLFASSGKQVARFHGDKAYGPDGRYVATLMGSRLVYLSYDSARVGAPFSPLSFAGFSMAGIVGVAMYGDEPKFADD
jgi:hypothetical protein